MLPHCGKMLGSATGGLAKGRMRMVEQHANPQANLLAVLYDLQAYAGSYSELGRSAKADRALIGSLWHRLLLNSKGL